jgi:hypothetical protein
MAQFDTLQDNLFKQVKTTMGYVASWQPSVGGDLQTATVLYNGPTEKEKLFSVDYDPDKLVMEYQDIDFIGLKLAVDTDPDAEQVIITLSSGDVIFKVKAVSRKWDGKTFEAHLKAIDVG